MSASKTASGNPRFGWCSIVTELGLMALEGIAHDIQNHHDLSAKDESALPTLRRRRRTTSLVASWCRARGTFSEGVKSDPGTTSNA